MIEEPFIEIPTWEADVWTTTVYQTRKEFATYIEDQFKEPGKYIAYLLLEV